MHAQQLVVSATYLSRVFCMKVLSAAADPVVAHLPEYGLDIGSVRRHAKRAIWLHLVLTAGYLYLTSRLVAALTPLIDRQIEVSDTVSVVSVIGMSIALAWTAGVLKVAFARHSAREQIGESSLLQRADTIVVHSGFLPFSGSGTVVSSWNIAIDTTIGKESVSGRQAPLPFHLANFKDELKDYVLERSPKGSSQFYVLSIPGEDWHLMRSQGASFTRPSPNGMATNSALEVPLEYAYFQSQDSVGDMVFTAAVRIHQSGTFLLIETTHCLLGPVKRVFRTLEREPVGLGSFVKLLFQSVLVGPINLLVNGFLTAFDSLRPARIASAFLVRVTEIVLNREFNYGGTSTIREWVADSSYHRFRQKERAEDFRLTIDSSLLEGAKQILDGYGIDTTSISDRALTIINSGTMVNAQTISATSLAIGPGSRANSAREARRASKAQGKATGRGSR